MPFGWGYGDMQQKSKFEDKTDPNKRCAPKAHNFDLLEDELVKGSPIIGQGHVWDIDDATALVLHELEDGQITAYIEKDED